MTDVDARKAARDEIKRSVPSNVWLQNDEYIEQLYQQIRQHPISNHPAIAALNSSTFGEKALKEIHLEYRHAIVQIFTDALLMAQYQCRQLEPRLVSGQKMFSRFLLTFNVLDEFGFTPDGSPDGSYTGDPNNAHYPLYEKVLSDLGISHEMRENHLPSQVSNQLRECLELSYNDLSDVVALLMVAEEVVVLFSAPLRENVKALGTDIGSGYYYCHGTSSDTQAQADDDTHALDLKYVLAQSLRHEEYERVSKLCVKYCDLWVAFWDLQLNHLLVANTDLKNKHNLPAMVA